MLRTTSQILSYHAQLEETQSNNYTGLAKTIPEQEPALTRLGKENLRHRDMALRAYREGVTDAFEVGFLAEPLDPGEYKLTEPVLNLSEAIGNEKKLIRFCMDAASSSSELIPDLPDTFERLVKRKKRTIEKLEEIERSL